MIQENSQEAPIEENITHSSSTIAHSQYKFEAEELRIEFNSGAQYVYDNVPLSEYLSFRDAESKGSYFAKNISRKFNYTKLD